MAGLTGNYSSPMFTLKMAQTNAIVENSWFLITFSVWFNFHSDKSADFCNWSRVTSAPNFGAGKVLGFMGKSTPQMVKP